MWHKPCRTFHPWCPCIKTRCLYHHVDDAWCLQDTPRNFSQVYFRHSEQISVCKIDRFHLASSLVRVSVHSPLGEGRGCTKWRVLYWNARTLETDNYHDVNLSSHCSDVIMSATASQITGVSIVYSTFCSGADQRRHQSSASLAFALRIHRWPVNSPHKGPVTRNMFPFDDVIMACGNTECRYDNPGVTRDDKVGIMKILGFQWMGRVTKKHTIFYNQTFFRFCTSGLLHLGS